MPIIHSLIHLHLPLLQLPLHKLNPRLHLHNAPIQPFKNLSLMIKQRLTLPQRLFIVVLDVFDLLACGDVGAKGVVKFEGVYVEGFFAGELEEGGVAGGGAAAGEVAGYYLLVQGGEVQFWAVDFAVLLGAAQGTASGLQVELVVLRLIPLTAIILKNSLIILLEHRLQLAHLQRPQHRKIPRPQLPPNPLPPNPSQTNHLRPTPLLHTPLLNNRPIIDGFVLLVGKRDGALTQDEYFPGLVVF
jgi:hypothetical protein